MKPCRPGAWKITLVVLYMAFIAFLSLIPMDAGATRFKILLAVKPTIQNLMHIPAYAALSILWMQVFTQYGRRGFARLVPALLVSVLFGVANEAAQSFVPGRYPSLTDALTNLFGAGSGVAVYIAAERMAPGRIRNIICE